MTLSNEDVLEILQILDASAYNEVDIQTGQLHLTLRRHAPGQWTQEARILTEPNPVPVYESADSAIALNRPDSLADDDKEGLVAVRTPLPGTFYRSPKPGSPPFIQHGSRVENNTIIGIMETMKLMNTIYADVSGEIVEICVADAQSIHENAILMYIRPEQS